jgi:hypothetical protein
MTTGAKKSIYSRETDNKGRFAFALNDEYGEEIEVLFSTTNKSNKSTANEVVLDKKKSPLISFEQQMALHQIDSIVEPFINKNLKQNEIDDKLQAQDGSTFLHEVKVNGKINPTRQKMIEQYGKPLTIISGKDILAKERSWSYGLYSVILQEYPDKIRIERDTLGNLQAIFNQMPTLVIIDGIPVNYRDYGFIQSIPPSEVTSFEIIENANGFIRLYCQVHTEIVIGCELGAPAFGHVIAIYTKQGIGLAGTDKPKGLSETSIPVFSMQKEFYAPKYENTNPDDWKRTDARTLLHWQPILNTDNLGSAATSFYNSDTKGNVMIVVEAISENGEIGYKELQYEIKDDKNLEN